MRWMSAAAHAGKTESQAALGEMYRRGRGGAEDFEAARQWYLRAAAGGMASAEFGLGDIYYQGLGCAGRPCRRRRLV